MQAKPSFLGVVGIMFLTSANLAFSGTADQTALAVTAQDTNQWWSLTMTTEYSSKYMFRGVNSLPGSGIGVTDLTLSVYDFSLDIWQAAGLRKRYDEVDFTLEWEHEVGPITLSGGYVNYYFPNDDGLRLGYGDTQELFVAASYNIVSSLIASLTYNFDFDKINGSYLELKLADSFSIVRNLASIDPYVSISYDFHYNSKTCALNNFEMGLDVPISLGKHVTMSGFAALSIPLHAINDFAKKEGWGGINITVSY
ncbi:MAG TPA: hypothetical protein VFQ43_05775 [Nitrososphaera sp.]|nr:hypothetical protein [Nitrososphaera sp.]